MKKNDKKDKRLTPKQQIFADYYIELGNAAEAYRRAGYKARNENARISSSKLLTKANVKEYIEKRQLELAERAGISQERILNELAKAAFANFTDFASWRTEKTQVGEEKDGTPIIGYDIVIDIKDSREIDGHVVSEIGRGKDGSFKFKLQDKAKAIESICRILGFNKDKTEHSGEVDLNIKSKIDFSGLTTDELRKLANIGDTETGKK